MTCWICGNIADSREHRFKASDIRLHIGDISQSNPLYKTPEGMSSKIIGSPNAKSFKFGKTICRDCNNNKTQEHDKSWERLSEYFYEHCDMLTKKGYWRPKNVFSEQLRKSLVDTHLFFVKFFGCVAKEHQINIDYRVLAKNILHNKPNNSFHLVFGKTPFIDESSRFAYETPVTVLAHKETQAIGAAFTYYIIGRIMVEIVYIPYFARAKANKHSWNPNLVPSKRISYRDFSKPDI